MGSLTSIERGPLVGAKEVAVYLGVGEATVLRMARKNAIPAHRVGCGTRSALWRFRMSEIDEWLANQQQDAKKETA